ncbi:ComEC/Rec2 family competence protein [Qipengyuania marisflavi]|uniref:ComEC family competence protein n=1 Tax=Qipengyuania marisflavi TaxID=2486356 RepID=A0A5S3P8Y7_9SPHN|nr:ComEC/Rec2 family competence protein [Qipengyuania marisflavi]TMM49972.1 ComEC family competence protein [Qipengyuania marisflavi]
MATQGTPEIPMGEAVLTAHGAVQRPWPMHARLSSFGDLAERFLGRAGFDRAPWLAVAFAGGIGLWFALASPWQWAAAIGLALLAALAAAALWRGREDRANLLLAVVSIGLAVAAGSILVWARSAMVGAEAVPAPRFGQFEARILERIEQPAEQRVRLVIAARDADNGRAIKLRVNVPEAQDQPDLIEGTLVRMRARLMPPAPPLVPGAYDFARRAWFEGLAATGSTVGAIEVIEPQEGDGGVIASLQRSLSTHVRGQLGGASGSIAAAFASGDRGAIGEADETAMRDAGLTHLLSISGLHVSAVIAAVYFLSLKLLALWPWIALRVRVPLVAAAFGAVAGIGYTLLTGAEVPTVRSCIGAVLVLAALALGREPLSLRMVAVAAIVVLALWPESLVGPSFQMSFSAVIAIVALHNARPIRDFLAPREENWWRLASRRVAMLFLTGLVIEIALTPVVLFHFHRSGLYGAFANVLAIPLVTFVSMPLIALALALDVIGLGAPVWWLAGQSLDALLALARFTSAQPGAVKLVPQMGLVTILLFVAGSLWLALWRGRARLWGFAAVAVGIALLATTPTPDVLISRDGRDVGIAGEGERLLVLRDTESSYARDNLLEVSAMAGEPIPLARTPGARCSPDFCTVVLRRGGRNWNLLIARSRTMIEERALAAACDQADIVIADRFLPRSCQPRWLKADRTYLGREGGLALYLADQRIASVGQSQGEHGWWRPLQPRTFTRR